MSHLTLETRSREKPILLFYGDQLLIQELIKKYSQDFKVAYVSDKELEGTEEENFYRIKKESVGLIGSLEEKLDYAVIYLDSPSRAGIASLFSKIETDRTKTIVLISFREANNFRSIINDYSGLSHVRFLFIGDLYYKSGKYLNTEIGKIIKQAVLTKTLNLTGNDLTPIFPIYLKDAEDAIAQVLFANASRSKYYYLFYAHPVTLISAVHIITRVEPDLEIKYGEPKPIEYHESFEEIQKQIKMNVGATPMFLDKYMLGFEKSLREFDAQELSALNKIAKDTLTQLPQKVLPKQVIPKKSHINILGRAALVSFILFIAFNFLFISLSALQLKTAVDAFGKSDFKSVASNIKIAKTLLTISEPTVELLARTAGTIGVKQVEASFDKAQTGINLLSLASEDLEKLQGLSQGVDRATLEDIIAHANYIYFRGEEERDSFESETLNKLLTEDFSKMVSLLQVSPDLLGYSGEKNYLILFQNNGELRPTGGFIGSLGEAKFVGGKMEEIKIQDVYEYDGQLKAHVEPHYIVRRYLQEHLYLRDSNFNPDFQESAKSAAQLYELETGRKVDGVIALNFEAVRQFIKEIGPLTLPGYDKTLDADNTFEFLQQTIDDNFFPGSSAKKDVLQALFNQITLKLEEDKTSFLKIARLIPQMMNEKHILFAFSTGDVQSTFSANGYAGEIKDARGEDTANDFLAINEANIGVNKANVNVLRETIYDAELEGSQVNSKVTHTLFNGNDKDVYKAYVRLIVPAGSELSSIEIDGVKQDITTAIQDFRIYEEEDFEAPDGLEVDRETIGNHSYFGFIVQVEPDSKQVIEISYSNGVELPTEDNIKYSMLLVKQPGTLEYPFTLNFNYGDLYSVNEVKNARLEKEKIVITDKVLSDKEFVIDLIKR